ncbi:MAG: response regulator transcription factor [Desmonostoc geniculatum HA4340-LM1]|jgi:DNA-binding response OmpR family regulator|nr:response regulator transcription factor [Desmonostoc geniculatum HA4340-LM1]
MTHILLIEDEVKLARFIESELNYEGYQVSIAYDGLTALTAARELHLDLVILDWIMPGLSGLEICRRLRSITNEVPIILLTVKDEVSDRITVLDAGADDYLVKPFTIDELLARVRIHLRKTHQADTADILEFEDLSLNRRTRQVYRCQRLIELTAKEFDLLEYFLIHPRQVITCDRILQQVWGYNFIKDANIIEPYIRYLRLKLEANNEKCLIQTVSGIGYTLGG